MARITVEDCIKLINNQYDLVILVKERAVQLGRGATPSVDPENKSNAIELKGEIPSALNPPSGCVFRTRCPNPTHDCQNGNSEMGLIEVEPGHWVDQCCVNCK